MTTITEQWQVLYGNQDGSAWYLLRGQYGRIPPDHINDLPLLGEPTELIRSLLTFRIQAAQNKTPETTQQIKNTLATELGITPQRLNNYLNDNTTPNLQNNGWTKLVKAYTFTTTETS